MKKDSWILASILLLAAILRLVFLGDIPQGVTHDELGYIYNAYSIAETGKNVFGETLPLFTWLNTGGFPFLPVPIYLSAPFFWLFPVSAFAGRLPAALLGIADVFLIYYIVRSLFQKKTLAFVSALFLAISPWHLHFSRSAYDPNFALFFYLLGIALFLFEVKEKRLPVLSVLALFLALFSYRGMNPIFPPLVLLLVWYGVSVGKVTRAQLGVFTIGIVAITCIFGAVVYQSGSRYTAEAQFYKDPKIQQEIDTQIREAQGPLFIRRLFLNKPMYAIGKFRENYIRAYSPEFLFLYTEPSKIYSIWSRGRIFFIDFPLIIAGILYLFRVHKKAAILVTAFLLIGGLPGMVGGFPYSARNFFLAAVFPVLSAAGILWLVEQKFLKKAKVLVIAAVVAAYVFVFGNYLFDYYARFAYYGSEAWVKSLKDVSKIIIDNRDSYRTIVVSPASFGDFMQYAFYTKEHPSLVQTSWEKRSGSFGESYRHGHIYFVKECVVGQDGSLPNIKLEEPILFIAREGCTHEAAPISAIRDYFGNTVWKIYEL